MLSIFNACGVPSAQRCRASVQSSEDDPPSLSTNNCPRKNMSVGTSLLWPHLHAKGKGKYRHSGQFPELPSLQLLLGPPWCCACPVPGCGLQVSLLCTSSQHDALVTPKWVNSSAVLLWVFSSTQTKTQKSLCWEACHHHVYFWVSLGCSEKVLMRQIFA